jgi:20S proteasome subunit alpha 6
VQSCVCAFTHSLTYTYILFITIIYLFINQVEYAIESVKQGSACVGLRSDKLCVLGALKRSVSELSSHQKKILEIDNHICCGIAGLTADARTLAKYMRSECLNHKYVYGNPIPPHQLMAELADKHQRTTQTYVRRPFGVGLLVASVHQTQPHLYQTCPSGNLYEFYASAIGARNQFAKTYLEKHVDSFASASKDDLIVHALQALVGCVSGDDELTPDNASIAIVGVGQDYELLEGDALKLYLAQLEVKDVPEEEGDEAEEAKEGLEAMET